MKERMTPYRHLGEPSGVVAYRIAPHAISVRFVDGGTYTYTYTYASAGAGAAEVEQMKQLARSGKGLATFISQHVRGNYATRHAVRPSGPS